MRLTLGVESMLCGAGQQCCSLSHTQARQINSSGMLLRRVCADLEEQGVMAGAVAVKASSCSC